MREVDMYSTIEDSVKMVVANKCDKVIFNMLQYHECLQRYCLHTSASHLLSQWLHLSHLISVCRPLQGK